MIVSINLSNAYLQVSDICRNVVATKSSNNDPAIIVILGESYSYFHSSLYDYEKATNPLLQNELLQGDLTIFDNVIAPSDHTSAVMRSIFSVGDGLSNTPLFPACLKNAGYRTIMYNNQYFIGEGERFFLSDLDISSAMFSARNANGYAFDGSVYYSFNNSIFNIGNVEELNKVENLYIKPKSLNISLLMITTKVNILIDNGNLSHTMTMLHYTTIM